MLTVPVELLGLIFSHVPPKCLVTVTPLVCRQWRRVSVTTASPNGAIPVRLKLKVVPTVGNKQPLNINWASGGIAEHGMAMVVKVTVKDAYFLANQGRTRDGLACMASRIAFTSDSFENDGTAKLIKVNPVQLSMDLSEMQRGHRQSEPLLFNQLGDFIAKDWFRELDGIAVARPSFRARHYLPHPPSSSVFCGSKRASRC